jgi:hypothetical protein
MRNFCTHFNIKYLSRALALHESMETYIKDYHLFMFVFDDLSYNILKELRLPNVDLIYYQDFEDEVLLKLKKERSLIEYLWTVTSFTLVYVFNNYDIDECTYIDADIYFFNDPSPVFYEVDKYNAIITEHRYNEKYEQSSACGRFCVQFNTFVRKDSSLKVLHDWKNSVTEWCYNRHENGMFGDQMYLDDWPIKYSDIHVAQHLGIGVAPWNVLSYSKFNYNPSFSAIEKKSNKNVQIIFYHFHSLTIYSNKYADLSHYRINKSIYRNIYTPYLISLRNANNRISAISNTKEIFTPFKWNWLNLLRHFRRILFQNFNFVRF